LAGANVEQARASKKAQKSSYFPTVTMSYSFNLTQGSASFSPSDVWLLSGSSPNRKNLNFNLQYPIFNGFTRETQSVNQDVALRNAEAQQRDARLAARANLTSLLRAAQNAEARISVQQQAIAAADEDLRVQQQRYALGASTLLDLLASQTALNQARQALIQARFDSRVTRAQLAALLGKPL
jgi:outer membrane protein